MQLRYEEFAIFDQSLENYRRRTQQTIEEETLATLRNAGLSGLKNLKQIILLFFNKF